ALELLDKLIKRVRARLGKEDDTHLERTLHAFICPMRIIGDDAAELKSRAHDLWVVDERLAFTRAFSSDKRLDAVLAEGGSSDRPDLLVWNLAYGLGVTDADNPDAVDLSEPLRSMMVVEFKKPGRTDYPKAEDNVEQQITKYLAQLKGGEIETFEALIRWQHPERGFISPAEFIPLAEQSGQIARIGQWVIETACATAVSWPKAWRVSVNVSPSQFRQSDVAVMVAAALARNGLEPNRLVVEITEGVFIENGAQAVAVLTNLREQGIRLALDDFGTGYSSLSYLQRFRFDKIKIDQSFVRTLGQNSDTLTIVRAIVNLGHNLGLQVTVEGVETIEQLRILQGLGCDQMQGYLFSRPMPLTVLADLVQGQIRNFFVTSELKAIA
ncbi:MAG: EAL domain-containing protein, partial [Oxalobacteraceae bacterium]